MWLQADWNCLRPDSLKMWLETWEQKHFSVTFLSGKKWQTSKLIVELFECKSRWTGGYMWVEMVTLVSCVKFEWPPWSFSGHPMASGRWPLRSSLTDQFFICCMWCFTPLQSFSQETAAETYRMVCACWFSSVQPGPKLGCELHGDTGQRVFSIYCK